MRLISWFSCGAASAVTTKLLIDKHGSSNVLPVRCIVRNEDEDNDRFADDCAEWFGRSIIELSSEKYGDCWQVWEETQYLDGPQGARCTTEMKKKVRQVFQREGDVQAQREGDVQALGYEANEWKRAKHFRGNNPEVNAIFPLIDNLIPKEECYEIVSKAGIELPLMYRLGYHNANCVGCVKGTIAYWLKIYETHPHVFHRMAKRERKIGFALNKTEAGNKKGDRTGRPIFLDELIASGIKGRHKDLVLPDCGLFCG